jgi:hypothetical protein
MGLLTGLLTFPLAPVRGVVWVADQLAAEAERQLYDEDRIRAELLALELESEEGTIDRDELDWREEQLLARLAAARLRAREAAGGDPLGWEPEIDG